MLGQPMYRIRRVNSALTLIGVTVLAPALTSAQRADTIVKTAGAARYRGVATLVPEVRIGMVDGPPEYLFGGPSRILALRSGSIAVIDWAGDLGDPIVRRYDAQGKFLGNLGRVGEGPGEYRGPTGLAEMPDGRIVLSDPRLRRVTLYAPTGAVDTVWTLT